MSPSSSSSEANGIANDGLAAEDAPSTAPAADARRAAEHRPDADFGRIPLQQLAEMEAPERAFLTVYLSSPAGLDALKPRIEEVRRVLAGEDDELEHFERSLERVRGWLEEHPVADEGAVVFACWALDFVRGFPLAVAPRDRLWLASSPFIKPLAELQDEYETFAVVAADNRATRVFLVSSAMVSGEERVRGDVKNRVKKGGWSQKRYARRREKELQHYAAEVAEVLGAMAEESSFDRIVLLGQKEAIEEIRDALPQRLADRLLEPRRIDLDGGTDGLLTAAFEVFAEGERGDERQLWERIREESLGHGLAALGATAVLKAALVGRVEAMAVVRDADIDGTRCRECENVVHGKPETCQVCGSSSVFHVDLVDELTRQVALHGGETDFTEPMPGLVEAGGVAALLRY
jgi:hypothetical protein